MRVVECSRVGSLADLEVVERPDPVAGPGTVVVQVEAAGVNYVDALFVQGRYQIKPPVPFVPGSEVAGVVIAVGDGVDGAVLGRRVIALCGLGGFAEQVLLGAASAVAIPDVLDAPRAATFIQSYCTARFALAERAGLVEGERVVVFGAGGGVGLAAVDVARAAGARVAAVASTPAKRQAALDAGAEVAFEPTDDATELVHALRDWSEGGVDVALDPVGGSLTVAALRALGHRGRLCVIGFPAGIAEVPANQILLRNRTVLGVDWGAWSMSDPAGQAALLDGLLTDVASGALDPAAPEARPLDAVVGALEDLLARRVTGKLALVP